MNEQENALPMKKTSRFSKRNIFITLCMAGTFSFIMSFVMTFVSLGFSDKLLIAWLTRWPIGFFTALPLSFYLPGFFMNLANKLNL